MSDLPKDNLLPPPDENNVLYYEPEVAHLANFALDFWRLKKRVEKAKEQIGEEAYKPIAYSLESCSRHLEGQKIELREFTGQEYKGSLNVDVVSYESDPSLEGEAVVKETLEPAILFEDHLFKKAKVIVVTPISPK
jgi:hypothetical protein